MSAETYKRVFLLTHFTPLKNGFAGELNRDLKRTDFPKILKFICHIASLCSLEGLMTLSSSNRPFLQKGVLIYYFSELYSFF